MRNIATVALYALVSVAGLAFAGPSRAEVITPFAWAGRQDVVAGVDHEWGTTATITGSSSVHVVRVAAGADGVHFETSLPHGMSRGQQRTSEQASNATVPGHRVVAAVNGDFFSVPPRLVAPRGLDVRDGELVSAGSGPRAAIGFDAAGSPVIGEPTESVSLTLPDGSSVPVGAVNQLRDFDGIVLYTPRFAARTGTDASGVEVVLSGAPLPLRLTGSFAASVAQVRVGAGDTALGADQIVLSAQGTYATMLSGLEVDDQVRLDLAIDSGWQDIVTAVGGRELVVHDGVAQTDFTRESELVPQPRTTAGITADGDLLLVTVDGRSTESAGVTLAELGEIMIALGVVEAVNLDGGGSTTMVVDPKGAAALGVVNTPSGGYERQVSVTLQLVSTATDPPAVGAPIVRLKTGMTAGRSDAAVEVSWAPEDDAGRIVRSELQRLDSSGEWQPVALSDPGQFVYGRRLGFGNRIRFRVRVTDEDGNTSPWSVSRTYLLHVVNERDMAIVRSGKWPVVYRTAAIASHFGRSSINAGSGPSVSLSYAGVQVAWVAHTNSLGGLADVRVDGVSVETISLHQPSAQARVVVYVGPALDETTFTTARARTIELVNVSDSSRPYVYLDAFLVLTVLD